MPFRNDYNRSYIESARNARGADKIDGERVCAGWRGDVGFDGQRPVAVVSMAAGAGIPSVRATTGRGGSA